PGAYPGGSITLAIVQHRIARDPRLGDRVRLPNAAPSQGHPEPMNRRILLLLAVIILGGLAWWLNSNDAPTTLDRPLSDFAVDDTSRVTRIHISDTKGGATVDL